MEVASHRTGVHLGRPLACDRIALCAAGGCHLAGAARCQPVWQRQEHGPPAVHADCNRQRPVRPAGGDSGPRTPRRLGPDRPRCADHAVCPRPVSKLGHGHRIHLCHDGAWPEYRRRLRRPARPGLCRLLRHRRLHLRLRVGALLFAVYQRPTDRPGRTGGQPSARLLDGAAAGHDHGCHRWHTARHSGPAPAGRLSCDRDAGFRARSSASSC